MNPIKRIFCKDAQNDPESQMTAERDPNISKLCGVINRLTGCRTSSSCPQHYFADDEETAPTEEVRGRFAYITVVCTNTSSLAVLVDAFTASPYKWKLILPKRHSTSIKLEPNEIRVIFQYAFDNTSGRDKEFDRLSKVIGEYVLAN